MMDPRLLHHYNRELGYLRRRAGEFSEEHRQVAGRLGIDAPTDPDPHVERLLEGVAFLNARVQLKIEDQFDDFTQYFLDALYPHYLAPTPAMAIAALMPRAGDEGLAQGILHPRGSELTATLNGQLKTPVEFRTAFDVRLWPVRISAVEYLPTRAAIAAVAGAALGEAGVRVRIQVTAPVALSELKLDELPLFVDGSEDTPNLLYQQLLSDSLATIVRPVDGAATRAGAIEPLGFGPQEAVLPSDQRAFRGYRLLCEYFAMPEKFRFVKLTGLRAGLAGAKREADIIIPLRRAIPALASAVSIDSLRPFVTPVVNLFERRFDRVLVDHRQREHLVLPDRANLNDYEVYRLDSVVAYTKGDPIGVPVLPLYVRRAERGARPLYYALRRRLRRLSEAETRRRRESDYVGTEAWISLSSPGAPALCQSITELGVRGLVTNRALATRLRPGAADLTVALRDARGIDSVRLIKGPSRPQPPLGIGDSAWRTISHLAVGHRGFVRDDGAPDLLTEHLLLYLRDEASALRREIQGITALEVEPVTRRVQGQARLAFQRGQHLIMSIASNAYDAGSAYLFTSVIARFLAEFATINSFAVTTVRTDSGLTWGWDACPGNRPTI